MVYRDIYKKTKEAFEKNEFYELLSGKDNYRITIQYVPSELTDWTAIIQSGIYELYNDTNNENIVTAYIAAINKMMHTTSVELWAVANILFYQLSSEKKKRAPFTIPDEIVQNFSKTVSKRKKDLVACKKYSGSEYRNGLYGDIERLNLNLLYHHKIHLLEE